VSKQNHLLLAADFRTNVVCLFHVHAGGQTQFYLDFLFAATLTLFAKHCKRQENWITVVSPWAALENNSAQ